MSVDFIGDFLTIIRNGLHAAKPFIETNHSNMRFAVAQILEQEGFIRGIEVYEQDGKKRLKVTLKYFEGESVIHEIKRISKLGRRFYVGAQDIKPVVNKLGISILTTNQGVISDKQARKLGVGGEIICTVW